MATISSILVFIVLGILLQAKLRTPDNQTPLRSIILNITLPSTIFVALLSIHLEADLLTLPIYAICLNLGLLAAFHLYLCRADTGGDERANQTLLLMLPSFTPGLSLFPFLVSFYTEIEVAWVSFADIGNKLFVLPVLYFIALRWHLKKKPSTSPHNRSIRRALRALFLEPINIMIFLAVVISLLGFGMESIPSPAKSILMTLSSITMPLTLIYVGLALKMHRHNLCFILSLLTLRSGISLLVSAAVIVCAPGLSLTAIVVVVLFPQSACSFWPLTHIYALNGPDSNADSGENAFDASLAVKVLALSFPFSCSVIFCLCASEALIADPKFLLVGSLLMFTLTAALKSHQSLPKKNEQTCEELN